MKYRISEGEFLKCGSQISSISVFWELLKMQILGPHQRPDESETERKPQESVFYQTLLVILKRANV